MPTYPTITVISICFNNLPELIETCQSVDIQSEPPFEHYIVDGSSDTEIRNYLLQQPQPGYRKWISEKDNGISDAFNKGINNSTGELIVMLNSGDTFFDAGVLKIVANKFIQEPAIMWLHGKYQLRRGNQWVLIGKPYERSKLYRGMRSICHQSMFVKRELYQRHGLYNTAEKIAMDYDFLCRIADEKYSFLSSPLIKFSPEGISSVQYLQSLRDAKRVYEKYYGKSMLLEFWQLRLKTLYALLHSAAGNWLYKIKTKLKLENM